MKRLLFILTFFASASLAFPQGTYIPLGSYSYEDMDRIDIKYARIIPIEHTADKPYLRKQVAKIAETLLLSNLRFNKVQEYDLRYLIDENAEWLDSLQPTRFRPLWKVLYTEPANFYTVSSKTKGIFDLRINPMLGVYVGDQTQSGRFIFTRTAGLEVRGNIKKVFSFYFNATGNDEHTPTYVENLVNPPKLTYLSSPYVYGYNYAFAYVPGEAYWKDYGSKIFQFKDAIDYFDARGYVNANILKFINLTFGRDKNFIGDGDRSLILSDYSAPYLFLKFNIHFWRINYDNIFAQLTSQYIRGSDVLLPKKYMALHHLSVQATHWLRLGIFETIIFNRSDNFELQYLNPIIFYRAVENSLGSPDNAVLGGDFKVNIAGHASVYGQLVIDDFNFNYFFKNDGYWANKWALQLGAKYIDIIPNLDGQIEFNYVRPYTYTHSDGTDDYTNYNQPLGDPLGANFYEFIFNLHFHPLPKLSFNAKYMVARLGTDTLINGVMTNYGGNISQPSDPGSLLLISNVPGPSNPQNNNLLFHRTGQGAKTDINYFELLATYQAWHNISFDANIVYRSLSTTNSPGNNNPLKSQSTFIFGIGARVNIARRTYEF